MAIAVIGWGSLIWCPKNLRIASAWHKDGPRLPIEFARISQDGRLTLVIKSWAEPDGLGYPVTYWAESEFDNIEDAMENLKIREGTSLENIHFFESSKSHSVECNQEAKELITTWLESKNEITAAIWTGLPSKFSYPKSEGKQFSVEAAKCYLEWLKSEAEKQAEEYKRAIEYIQLTPRQIETPLRKMVRAKLDLQNIELADCLFENPVQENSGE